MAEIGYTMMCEQTPPRQLIEDVARAERVGFGYAVISDHYFPWLEEMGHSPYAWSVLGAAAQATERLPLMTYVTCPIMRCHPAVVAQKAATSRGLVRRPAMFTGSDRRGQEPLEGRPRFADTALADIGVATMTPESAIWTCM